MASGIAPVKREKPGTKECQNEEQVSPTVVEFHVERRVELISDLQSRVKWILRSTVDVSDLISAVTTVRYVFWVVEITTVNRHKFTRPCQAGLSGRRIKDSEFIGSTFDDESSMESGYLRFKRPCPSTGHAPRLCNDHTAHDASIWRQLIQPSEGLWYSEVRGLCDPL